VLLGYKKQLEFRSSQPQFGNSCVVALAAHGHVEDSHECWTPGFSQVNNCLFHGAEAKGAIPLGSQPEDQLIVHLRVLYNQNDVPAHETSLPEFGEGLKARTENRYLIYMVAESLPNCKTIC
jgi:hypothetical protein